MILAWVWFSARTFLTWLLFLGASAVVAGHVRIKRQGLLLNGGVALLITVVISALIFGAVGRIICGLLLAVIFLPYCTLLALRPAHMKQLHFPGPIERFLSAALAEASKDARKDQQAPQARWSDMLAIIPSLVSIVLASVGMINTATSLGAAWHVPHVIIGTFVLATLTGIPNMLTAMRLALHGRGSSVVSVEWRHMRRVLTASINCDLIYQKEMTNGRSLCTLCTFQRSAMCMKRILAVGFTISTSHPRRS